MKILKLLLPMLCGLCFFCYSTVGGAVPVAASGEVGGNYTLTAEETLALYGTNISGQFYNVNKNQTFPIIFTYQTTMNYWRPLDYDSTPTYIYDCNAGRASGTAYSGAEMKARLEQRRFLVYTAYATLDTYPFPKYGGDEHSMVTLSLPFSVQFSGINWWSQDIMWSNWYNYDRTPAENSYCTNAVNGEILRKYPFYFLYSAYERHKLGLVTFPFYRAISVESVPDREDGLMYASIIPNDFIVGDFEDFDISMQQLSLNWCDKYEYTHMDSNITNPYMSNSYGNEAFAAYLLEGKWYTLTLFISCPTVSTLNPLPDFNTTTAETEHQFTGSYSTAAYETYPSVDLSALESGVGTMVKQIDEGNYYERIQIDQLNTIIQQLNDIYAKMVANGEVPVQLDPASSAQRFDSSILDQVQNAATSYTIAQLPQDYAGNGATGIGAFIAQVVGVDPVFMTIGLFSIGFAIFCWFVFRGRGGV